MGFVHFDITCPNCGNPLKIYGEDSEGPFGEAGAECESCGASVVQDVECNYSYDLKGEPQVIDNGAEVYGFIYTVKDRHRYRTVKAENVKQACDRMMAFIDRYGWASGDCVVDYEVDIGGKQVDLYPFVEKVSHPIGKYLP